MRTENQRLWGFVTVALGVEMFLSVISITVFLGIGIISAIIGSVLYLDATRAVRDYKQKYPLSFGLDANSFDSDEDNYHEPLMESFNRNVPEIFRPGSAAQQIASLRQEEANRAR